MSKVVYDQTCIWPKLYMAKVVYDQRCLWPKLYMAKAVYGQRCLWPKLYIATVVYDQRCLWPKLYMVKAVQGQSCLWSKLFMAKAAHGQNCIWPNNGQSSTLPNLYVATSAYKHLPCMGITQWANKYDSVNWTLQTGRGFINRNSKFYHLTNPSQQVKLLILHLGHDS